MPSIGAHLGVPGCREDVLGLPAAERYVVVLVDGLGWNLLRRSVARRAVPGVAARRRARPITSGVPSTTVTSLASLGTGLVPGQHGMVGYTSRVPSTGEILNALTWESDLVARAYQPKPTFFERAAAAGVAVSSVALQRFADTGLTEAALRGAEFLGYEDDDDVARRTALTVAGGDRGERSVVYGYERELDHHGHASGCASAEWRGSWSRWTSRCQPLRDALPDDVRLVITADHGMLDIPLDQRLVAEDEPELHGRGDGAGRRAAVPPALRRPGPAGARGASAGRTGSASAPGCGPGTRRSTTAGSARSTIDLRERYGHVLVAMRDDWAVMTRQLPRELTLVGMHGSLTADEMLVPLLVD